MSLFDDVFGEDLIRDLFGLKGRVQKHLTGASERREELLKELRDLTTDEEDETIITRALATYLAMARTTKEGGSVKFILKDGKIRTAKLRLR